MTDSVASLRKKITSAADLESVVRTMKAMAASNIGQYEAAVASLENYYTMVALGLVAYFNKTKMESSLENQQLKATKEKSICAIVFGSDQATDLPFISSIEYIFESFRTYIADL